MDLALLKPPMESGWINSNIPTSEAPVQYNEDKGYAAAYWPKNFTIDLTSEYPIKTILFLFI